MFKSSGMKECLGGYYQNKVLETSLVSCHYLVLLDWTSQTAKTSWMEYFQHFHSNACYFFPEMEAEIQAGSVILW